MKSLFITSLSVLFISLVIRLAIPLFNSVSEETAVTTPSAAAQTIQVSNAISEKPIKLIHAIAIDDVPFEAHISTDKDEKIAEASSTSEGTPAFNEMWQTPVASIESFIAHYTGDSPPSPEQVQIMAQDLGIALRSSNVIQEELKALYLSMDNQSPALGILHNLLFKSEAGLNLLSEVAHQALEDGDVYQYKKMFNTLLNDRSSASEASLNATIDVLNSTDDIGLIFNAMNYLDKIPHQGDLAERYHQSAMNSLSSLYRNHPEEDIKRVAAQKLLRHSEPQLANNIAIDVLSTASSPDMVITVLNAIRNEHIAIDEVIHQQLLSTLTREQISIKELDFAKRFLPDWYRSHLEPSITMSANIVP